MAIRELFHVMQIVDDFDEADKHYNALMAPQVYMPKSWSDFDKRWASLAVIGPDFVFEIMEPSKLEADAGAPLPKFHGRHGQHIHSMSWFVDADYMGTLMQKMRDYGVRVLTPYNTDNPEDPIGTFFTHPKDTFGQMEFQAAGSARHADPHLTDGWTGAYWRDEHPLGLLGSSHVTTIVADIERAKDFYAKVLDAPAFFEEQGPDRLSAFAMVGTELVVELAQPIGADSRLARDLAAHGELPHAMTFKVGDLDAVERHVKSIGMGIAERDDSTLVVDPADLCNAVVAFTTRQLPGDPRSR